MSQFWSDFTREKHTARDHSEFSDLDKRAGIRCGILVTQDEMRRRQWEGDNYFEGLFQIGGGIDPKVENVPGDPPEEFNDFQGDPGGPKSFGGTFAVSLQELEEEEAEELHPYRNYDQERDERYEDITILGQPLWETCRPARSTGGSSAEPEGMRKIGRAHV